MTGRSEPAAIVSVHIINQRDDTCGRISRFWQNSLAGQILCLARTLFFVVFHHFPSINSLKT
jgi:hypothetical protein